MEKSALKTSVIGEKRGLPSTPPPIQKPSNPRPIIPQNPEPSKGTQSGPPPKK